MTVLEKQMPRKKKDTETQEENLASDSLAASFKKGDLTAIKGIGPSVAEKFKAQGFTTVEDIAQASPHQISSIKGIGFQTAEKFIENAKLYLSTHKKNLASFSEPQITESHSNQSDDDLQHEKSQSHNKIDESTPSFSNSLEFEEVNETGNQDKFEPWFDPKYNISRLGKSYDTKKRIVVEDEDDDISEDYEDEEPQQNDVIKEPNLFQREETSIDNQIEKTEIHISEDLERSGFYIIKKTPELRQLFLGIDYLAIKLIRVKEFLDLIYIIPLKVCTLKGSLVVSVSTVKYHPTTDEKDVYFKLKGVPESLLEALHTSGHNIFQDIVSKGTLFSLIKQYLQLDISLKKTLVRDNLFFHSGPLQYKFLVEPIMIAQGTVGFAEKLIPFAYHKNTNIHIIEVSQLPNFLDYIEQKYFLIENHTRQNTAIVHYEEALYKFTKNIRYFSIPFMLFGFVFLSLLFFQVYSFLLLLINLGYGVIALYGIGWGYLYLKYYQHKSFLQSELSTPYYQRKYEFNDSDLTLITEEFSPKLMEQFIYECVNKEISPKIIDKVEQENAEAYFSSKVAQRTIKESSLFESELTNPVTKKKKESKFNDHLANKYSSFLED